MTNKPMLSVEREPVAWAVEISGCLKFFEQKKSAENARRRYEKVMDAERMEPFPLCADQPAPVAVVMPDLNKVVLRRALEVPAGYTLDGSMKYELQIWQAAIEEVARLNGVKP